LSNDDEIASAATQVSTQPELSLAPGSPALPTLLADRYAILGLLGTGGMGHVYRAHDRLLDEIVALKMLRRELVGMPGMLERFHQEVKLARRVTSPHVVRTFDLGQHGDDHFLTMEYIDGRSLARLLQDGPLSWEDFARIARAAAAGLEAAHATGVLHRDLKPDNILVAKTGRIALSDFGIARPSASPLETADRFVGTPAYMSPEQVEGADQIGPAADVYAFGAIMYEMLTGRRPFPGADIFAVASARLRRPPPDPRAHRDGLSELVAELVLHCMARDPAARPGDGSALATALATIDDTVSSTTRPAHFVPPVPVESARAVAILPLRATGELAELADGLSEEIVDALSMSRNLLVRPLGSVRTAMEGRSDAREIGKALGVAVVIDGSVRRRGELVRISSRMIGVDDGFQLWANHFDATPDGLLAVGDDIVRAIAQALTVDLAVPPRSPTDPLAALYLETKARLRSAWLEGEVADIIAELDRVPHVHGDPALLATLALALARSGFYGNVTDLARARPLAERAVALAPGSDEAWLARAYACLYAGVMPEALHSLLHAVRLAPGFAVAQSLLGELLLEAGDVPDALLHLEASRALDPTGVNSSALARAYVYDGRKEAAFALLENHSSMLAELSLARFKMWFGEWHTIRRTEAPGLRPELTSLVTSLARLHSSSEPSGEALAELEANIHSRSGGSRLRASQSQFYAEYLAVKGKLDRALEYIAVSVTSGLYDYCWIERCPVLAPLRNLPEFQAHAAVVRGRANAMLAVMPGHNATGV
jgi:serine/threonine-protein kinase